MAESIKVVTIDELSQMKPPHPHIAIARRDIRRLRGTYLKLAEHIVGKLCPICGVPVTQKFKTTGLERIEPPIDSVCPQCGLLFEHNRWKFPFYRDYDDTCCGGTPLYQFDVKLGAYDWDNYLICPICKEVNIYVLAYGEGSWKWKGGIYGGGDHEWRVSQERKTVPMSLEMVGCNGEEFVESIYETDKEVMPHEELSSSS